MISIVPLLTDLKLRLTHSFKVKSVRHPTCEPEGVAARTLTFIVTFSTAQFVRSALQKLARSVIGGFASMAVVRGEQGLERLPSVITSLVAAPESQREWLQTDLRPGSAARTDRSASSSLQPITTKRNWKSRLVAP
jgi:hypothetical protein